jgi:PAS domain S-box-containing protein
MEQNVPTKKTYIFQPTQVLDNIPDGITIQDRDFNILYQNNAMRHAFGDHIGAKCYEIYERRDQVCEECGLLKSFETGKPVMVHRTAVREDGSKSHWENVCFSLKGENGDIVAGVEVCRDVSERSILADEVKERSVELGIVNDLLVRRQDELKQQSQELENAYHELQISHTRMLQQEKMASIGQLAAGIAHEINTPIQFVGDNITFLRNAVTELIANMQQFQKNPSAASEQPVEISRLHDQIFSLLQQLDFDYLSEEIPLALEQAAEGIRRVADIVLAMKTFAHPNNGVLGRVELDTIIHSTVEISRNAWKMIADMDIDLATPAVAVTGQKGDIGQVLLNLIVNAADAIEDRNRTKNERGRIRILTRRNGDWGEIHVVDSGCGIEPSIQKKIFEPFFTTKEVGQGSGQGLAIAYNIVTEIHGGELLVDTELGKGSTFIVRLPLIE